MKRSILFFILVLWFGMQMIAANLVIQKTDATQLIQDIAKIGKWVFVGEDLQLLNHEGILLAQERLSDIRKITFSPNDKNSVDNIQSHDIVIYPNPTHDVLFISGVEANTLRVFDMQGRLLKSQNGIQINVSDLAEGTYLLQVGTQVVRFIKK